MSYEIQSESAPTSVLLFTGEIAPEQADGAGTMGLDGYTALVSSGLSRLLDRQLGLAGPVLEAAGLHPSIVHVNTISRTRLAPGAPFEVEARVVDRDPRHLVLFFTIWSGDDIAAISELLLTLIDANGEPQAFPDSAQESIERLYLRQDGLPPPFLSGSTVGLPADDSTDDSTSDSTGD